MSKQFILGIICLFFVLKKSTSQNKIDTVYIEKFPVKYGIAMYNRYTEYDPAPGIFILSSQDSVFHFTEGNVRSIFTIEGDKVVLIKNHDGYFVSYAGLKDVYLNKGDSVSKGTCLGVLRKNEDDNFELQLIVVDSKSQSFYFDKTTKFLEKYISLKQSKNIKPDK